MGEEGCHRLRCGRRGARASFLPGSGESNGIVSPAATSEDARPDHGMKHPHGRRPVRGGPATSQREATPLAPPGGDMNRKPELTMGFALVIAMGWGVPNATGQSDPY